MSRRQEQVTGLGVTENTVQVATQQHSTSFVQSIVAPLAFYCGFALWFGAFMFFGIGVAAVLFAELPVDQAGQLNSLILMRLNVFEFTGAVLMLLGLGIYQRSVRGLRNRLPMALLPAAIISLVIYAVFIGPEMRALHAATSEAGTNLAVLSAKFDALHEWYTTLAGVTLGLIFVTFLLQSFNFSLPPALRNQSLGHLVRLFFPLIKIKD